MAKKSYEIHLTVVEERTGRALSGLRVEAWDWDKDHSDLLDVATTDARGQVRLVFDETYFVDSPRERGPDLFFRVMRGSVEIASTLDRRINNLKKQKLEQRITVKFLEPAARAPDRLKFSTAMSLGRFVQQSQFGEVLDEGKDRARLAQGLLGDYVRDVVDNLEPLTAPSVRVRGVVGRDAATATKALEEADVEVVESVTVGKRSRDALLGQIKQLPSSAKAGDKVRMYVDEDGNVLSYTFVSKTDSGDGRIAADELVAARAEIAARDKEVATLRSDLESMKSTQATLLKEVEAMRKRLDG